MTRTITVIFDGQVLRPTEPLDLEPETAYRVTIEEDNRAEQTADRPLMRFTDITIDTGLGDLAEQHDHYLYGTLKR